MVRLQPLIALAFGCLVISRAEAETRAPLTGPLADYVVAQDDSYRWAKRSEGSVLTCKYVELTLTSTRPRLGGAGG